MTESLADEKAGRSRVLFTTGRESIGSGTNSDRPGSIAARPTLSTAAGAAEVSASATAAFGRAVTTLSATTCTLSRRFWAWAAVRQERAKAEANDMINLRIFTKNAIFVKLQS
jgi:hypothetical protein